MDDDFIENEYECFVFSVSEIHSEIEDLRVRIRIGDVNKSCRTFTRRSSLLYNEHQLITAEYTDDISIQLEFNSPSRGKEKEKEVIGSIRCSLRKKEFKGSKFLLFKDKTVRFTSKKKGMWKKKSPPLCVVTFGVRVSDTDCMEVTNPVIILRPTDRKVQYPVSLPESVTRERILEEIAKYRPGVEDFVFRRGQELTEFDGRLDDMDIVEFQEGFVKKERISGAVLPEMKKKKKRVNEDEEGFAEFGIYVQEMISTLTMYLSSKKERDLLRIKALLDIDSALVAKLSVRGKRNVWSAVEFLKSTFGDYERGETRVNEAYVREVHSNILTNRDLTMVLSHLLDPQDENKGAAIREVFDKVTERRRASPGPAPAPAPAPVSVSVSRGNSQRSPSPEPDPVPPVVEQQQQQQNQQQQSYSPPGSGRVPSPSPSSVVTTSISVNNPLPSGAAYKKMPLNEISMEAVLLKPYEAPQTSSIRDFARRYKNLELVNYADLKLQKFICQGATGNSLYKGLWRCQPVCFKAFPPVEFSGFEELMAMKEFHSEIKVINMKLRHPHILHILGVVIQPKHIGIVTPFCEYGDMKKFLSMNKDITMNERLRLCFEIADAMAYLHSHDIIHRELKIQNLLVTKGARVKVTDFGLSKIVKSAKIHFTKNVGDPFFTAPEVISEAEPKYSSKVDVYSAALAFLQILTGDFNPWQLEVHGVSRDFLQRIKTDAFFRPNLTLLRKKVQGKQWIVDMIEQSWLFKPEERPTMERLKKIIIRRLRRDNRRAQRSGSDIHAGGRNKRRQRERRGSHNSRTSESPTSSSPDPTGLGSAAAQLSTNGIMRKVPKSQTVFVDKPTRDPVTGRLIIPGSPGSRSRTVVNAFRNQGTNKLVLLLKTKKDQESDFERVELGGTSGVPITIDGLRSVCRKLFPGMEIRNFLQNNNQRIARIRNDRVLNGLSDNSIVFVKMRPLSAETLQGKQKEEARKLKVSVRPQTFRPNMRRPKIVKPKPASKGLSNVPPLAPGSDSGSSSGGEKRKAREPKKDLIIYIRIVGSSHKDDFLLQPVTYESLLRLVTSTFCKGGGLVVGKMTDMMGKVIRNDEDVLRLSERGIPTVDVLLVKEEDEMAKRKTFSHGTENLLRLNEELRMRIKELEKKAQLLKEENEIQREAYRLEKSNQLEIFQREIHGLREENKNLKSVFAEVFERQKSDLEKHFEMMEMKKENFAFISRVRKTYCPDNN